MVILLPKVYQEHYFMVTQKPSLKSVLLLRYLLFVARTLSVYIILVSPGTSIFKESRYCIPLYCLELLATTIFHLFCCVQLYFSSINLRETKIQRTKRHSDTHENDLCPERRLQLYFSSINFPETKSQRTKRHPNTHQNVLYPKKQLKMC